MSHRRREARIFSDHDRCIDSGEITVAGLAILVNLFWKGSNTASASAEVPTKDWSAPGVRLIRSRPHIDLLAPLTSYTGELIEQAHFLRHSALEPKTDVGPEAPFAF